MPVGTLPRLPAPGAHDTGTLWKASGSGKPHGRPFSEAPGPDGARTPVLPCRAQRSRLRQASEMHPAKAYKNLSVSVRGEFFTNSTTNARSPVDSGGRALFPARPHTFQDASSPISSTMAGRQLTKFWPFCVVFIITNDIRGLVLFSHDVFETHNNPNETLWLGNILLRASSGR